MNDSEIIRKLKNREEEGLRGLIRQYTPYVTAILCNISRGILSLEDIEELAADVFWSVCLQQTAPDKGAPHRL